MNFDNQGIVSGTFLRQRRLLLLVDGATYFTVTYYKMHFVTTGYTTTKINAWEDHEVWTLVGKATNFWTRCAYFCWGNGYFYVRRLIIITVFPWQFWLKPKVIVIALNIWFLCWKNHLSTRWRCSVKEGVLKNFACNFLKKTPAQVFSWKTWQIFKNIYFQEHLRTTVSTGHYRKSYSSISFTKLGLHNYYYNLWGIKSSFVLLCSYSFF